MQTQKRQPNSSSDGGSTPRMTWWTCFTIHSYRRRLLRTLRSQVSKTYHEEMVLPLHLPDNQSSTHWSSTIIGHPVMSGCSDKIHCESWLPEHHHQRKWSKLRWSSQWAENIHERVGQSKDREWFSIQKYCLEIQSSWSPYFVGIWQRVVQSCKKAVVVILDDRCLADEVLSTTMCLVEQTLNARTLTAVTTLKTWRHLHQIFFC